MAVKLSRMGARTYIPLQAVDGSSCYFVNGEPIQSAVHQIDMRAGGNVNLPSDLITPDVKDQYLVRSLVEEAIHSSQLEGATTTRLVAKRMLREGRSPKDRSEQMILNNYRTMCQLAEWRSQPLTPELVLEIHRQVTDSTLDGMDIAGRLRRPDEHVVVGNDVNDVYHVPPPAHELERRLSEMCRFANGETPDGFLHPLVRAIVLHYWLAYDHPFVDGNGRTARALFYWSMLRSGYWLFEFISISVGLVRAPAQYGRAFLYTQTDDNDLTYFLLHQLQVVKSALDELHDYLRATEKRVKETERLLESFELNHRQQALAAHALRHQGQQYTIEGHQTSHHVAYQTARTDLLDLEQKGLLRSRKSGKKLVFEGTTLLTDQKKVKGRFVAT
jgi:Fic family protein